MIGINFTKTKKPITLCLWPYSTTRLPHLVVRKFQVIPFLLSMFLLFVITLVYRFQWPHVRLGLWAQVFWWIAPAANSADRLYVCVCVFLDLERISWVTNVCFLYVFLQPLPNLRGNSGGRGRPSRELNLMCWNPSSVKLATRTFLCEKRWPSRSTCQNLEFRFVFSKINYDSTIPWHAYNISLTPRNCILTGCFGFEGLA